MQRDKCFKALYGFCSSLECPLERDDCAIKLDAKVHAQLCQMLGDEFYTYMVVHDGICHEILMVEYSEGLIYAERGIDDTKVACWPCGASIRFDWVASAIWDQNYAVKALEQPECPEELFSGKIKNGNCTVVFKDGLAVKETVNKHPIRKGCYDSPVITVDKHGCISDIGEGANVPTHGYPLPTPGPGCCDGKY